MLNYMLCVVFLLGIFLIIWGVSLPSAGEALAIGVIFIAVSLLGVGFKSK